MAGVGTHDAAREDAQKRAVALPPIDRDVRRAATAVLALPDSRIARRHLERALGRAA